jgi:hypothetical protein
MANDSTLLSSGGENATNPVRFTYGDLSRYRSEHYEITRAEISGTTLEVSVTYDSGYLAHEFSLYVVAESSSPPRYQTQIVDKGAKDSPMGKVSQDLAFDLSGIANQPFTITIDDKITLEYIPPAALASTDLEGGSPTVVDPASTTFSTLPSLGDTYAARSKGRPFWFALGMTTQLLDTANIVAKGIIENQKLPDGEFSTAFPIIPYPDYGLWRVGNERTGLKEAMSAFLDKAIEGRIDPVEEEHILQNLRANGNLDSSTKKKVEALIGQLHDESLTLAQKKAKAARIEYLIGGANDYDGFNDFQDSWTLAVGLTNLGLTNYFIDYQLVNPPVIRTDGQLGFAFGILNHVMEPQHLADDAAILISNHQLGTTPGDIAFRTIASVNATWTIVNSSILWKGMEPLFDTGCSPVKLDYFGGDAALCDAYMNSRPNGNAAGIQFAFDDPDDGDSTSSQEAYFEGLQGQSRVTLQLAESDYRQAYAYGSYLLFQELEIDGRPSWASLGGVAPYVLDVAINAKMGQPLDGNDLLERGALAGGALLLNSISTDPDLNVPNAHALAYAAKSPDYMTIVSDTTAYTDPLAFLTPNQTGYDNPDSILTHTSPFAVGGYSFDSFWNAGVMSGYALTTSDGLQQWAPLATTAVGFALQIGYNDDPANAKYLALGGISAGLGIGVGALMGSTNFGRTIMAMNPHITYDPVSDTVGAGITIPLDKPKK